MIEGKFTEAEALSQSYDMLSAGIDTVTIKDVIMEKKIRRQKTTFHNWLNFFSCRLPTVLHFFSSNLQSIQKFNKR